MSRSLLKRGTLLTPADNGTYAPANPAKKRLKADFGAKGDVQRVHDAIIDASGNITSASALFTPADVGKNFYFFAAGSAHAPTPSQSGILIGTITGFTDASHIAVTATQGTPIVPVASNGFLTWGTDDTAAILAWATALATVVNYSNAASGPFFAAFEGEAEPGQYLYTSQIDFGGTTGRLDGLKITWGGAGACRFVYGGPSCNDGSGSGSGGTFPLTGSAGEVGLHFRQCWNLRFIGGLVLDTVSVGLVFHRVALWIDPMTGGAGQFEIESLDIREGVTACYLGGALVYTGGTWLDPTGVTFPNGQYNGGIIRKFSTSPGSVIEDFRIAGSNGEEQLIEQALWNGVTHVRVFGGRGVHVKAFDGGHFATSYPFPSQDPSRCYVFDITGSAPSGGAFTIENGRDEQAGPLARFWGGANTKLSGVNHLTARDYHVDGPQPGGIHSGTRTLTASMDGTTEKLTFTSGLTSNDKGSIVLVPGAGPAGATLTSTINSVAGQVAYLNAASSTATGSVTVTIVGLANPLPLVQGAFEGSILLEDCDFIQPGAYLSVEQLAAASVMSVRVRGCGLPSATATDTDPTTFLRVHATAGGTTGGVDADFQGNYLAGTDNGTHGRLTNRAVRITTNDARAGTTTVDSSMNGTVLYPAVTGITLNIAAGGIAAAGLGTSGKVLVLSDRGAQLLSYTGSSAGTGPGGADQLTGVTGGQGVLSTGAAVLRGIWEDLGLAEVITSISGTYAATNADKTIYVTGGTFNLTFPAPVKGKLFRIVNTGSGTVTFVATSGGVLGAATLGAGNVTPTHVTFRSPDGTNFVQEAA